MTPIVCSGSKSTREMLFRDDWIRAYLFVYPPEQAVYSGCSRRFNQITFQARYKFR